MKLAPQYRTLSNQIFRMREAFERDFANLASDRLLGQCMTSLPSFFTGEQGQS